MAQDGFTEETTVWSSWTSGENTSVDALMSRDSHVTTLNDDSGESYKPMFLEVKAWYRYVFGVDILVNAWGFVGNIVVLLAFIKYPELRKPTNYLIMSLAASDLLTCTSGFCALFFMYTELGLRIVYIYKYSCIISVCVALASVKMSFTNLLLISLERLLAVAFPLKHLRLVTKRTVKVIIAIAWISIMSTSLLPALGWNTWQPGRPCRMINTMPTAYLIPFYFLIIVVDMTSVAIVSIIIAVLAFRNSKSTHLTSGQTGDSTRKQQQIAQYKITKMLLTVIGVFYLAITPYIVVTVLTNTYFAPNVPQIVFIIQDAVVPISSLIMVVNPIIYAKQNRKFREAFKKLVQCK